MSFKNRRGFSLVEVMVGISLMGVMTASVTTFFKYASQSNLNTQTKSNFNKIFDDIVANVENQPAIILSYTLGSVVNSGNAFLQFCAVGSAGNFICPNQAFDPNNPIGFLLYKSTNPANTQGFPIAGPPNAPIRYRATGERCSTGETASPRCPFEASIAFSASCNVGQNTCATPTNLYFSIALRHSRDASNNPVVIAQGIPTFVDKTYTKTVPRIDFVRNLTTSCPNGFVNSGWQANGEPICNQTNVTCQTGQIFNGFINGQINCQPFNKTCLPSEEQLGVNGVDPICVPKNTSSCGNGAVQTGVTFGVPQCSQLNGQCWNIEGDDVNWTGCDALPGGHVVSSQRFDCRNVCSGGGKKGPTQCTYMCRTRILCCTTG